MAVVLSNSDIYYLPFDDDEMWISRRRLYFINDDIVLRLINGSSVYV